MCDTVRQSIILFVAWDYNKVCSNIAAIVKRERARESRPDHAGMKVTRTHTHTNSEWHIERSELIRKVQKEILKRGNSHLFCRLNGRVFFLPLFFSLSLVLFSSFSSFALLLFLYSSRSLSSSCSYNQFRVKTLPKGNINVAEAHIVTHSTERTMGATRVRMRQRGWLFVANSRGNQQTVIAFIFVVRSIPSSH